MTWAMDELEARAASQLGRLQDFSEALAAISVRETSADDLVTVEVDGSGALTGLWLADIPAGFGGTRLGESIAATAMRAAHRAFARRAELTEDFAAAFTG
ncbi:MULTISPECIES: YbaB/EbfC family DNA-binding protein [unclassified Gordonia (in: high G+C Gram-positive bacteria)]